MSAVASIKDGVLQDTTSTTKPVNESKSGSGLGKDAFLQLLVTQMKYQDPLEPTSNTEYISQYATFSEVESLQNMATAMDSNNALTLTGKYVTVDVTNGSGVTSSVSGKVDYVEKSGKDVLLYIDGTPYNYENLNTVWDEEYLSAYEKCSTWAKSVSALPSLDSITLAYKDSIEALRQTYDAMSSYEKSYIGSSLVDILQAAEARIATLEGTPNNKTSDNSSDSNGSTSSEDEEGADA